MHRAHTRVTPQAPVCRWWKLEGNESHHSRARFAHVAPAAPTTTNVATGAHERPTKPRFDLIQPWTDWAIASRATFLG